MRNEMVKLIAAIGKTLVHSGTTQQLLQHVAEEIATHLDAALIRIWTLNAAADTLELQASAGSAATTQPEDRVAVGEQLIGRIASDVRSYV